MNVRRPGKKKNKWIMAIVAIMAPVILVIGTILFLVQYTGDNKGYRTVSVVEVSGKVGVVKNGVEYNAYPGMLLQEGHEIVTSGDSFVRLVLDEDKYIKLESGSKLIFESLGGLGSGKTRLCLERGSISTELTRPLREDEQYVVNTPNAVLAVRGTFFRVDLETAENGDIVAHVMTYGGKVASQRILPTGIIVDEEVLIDAGYKTCINMSKEDTHYVIETEQEKEYTSPIVMSEIPDDDLVDIFFSAQKGHELFVTPEEIREDIIERDITLEEKTSVYQMSREIREQTQDIIVDDSNPLIVEEEEAQVEDAVSTQLLLTDGNNHTHDEVIQQTEATCDEAGKVIVSCGTCNEVLEQTEIPALGHSYGEWMVTTVADCENAGSQTHTCSVCGKEESENIPATGHSYGQWSVTVAADCENAGSRKNSCSSCGKEETEVIPALGHSYANGFTVDTEATCTTVGSKSKHCEHEGCDSVSEVTEIPVTDHSYGQWNVTAAADCENAGSRKHSCNGCGKQETETIPATGHSYGQWNVTVAADCENAGSQTHTCSACGNEESEIIPVLGHSYGSEFTVDIAATCTAVGSQSKHCEHDGCDSMSEVTEIPATGHSYGQWNVTVAADCENAGSQTHTCSACGNEESETIPALGHSYGSEFTVDIAATCTAVGSKSKHCGHTGCDSTSEVTEIPATGHSYGQWNVTVAADCENAGSQTHTCNACGNEESETIPALGHSYESEFTVDIAATCTAVGSKSKHCEHDGCGSVSEVTEIPALGHQDAGDGTCSNCGAVAISTTNFPDTTFRILVEGYDTNPVDNYLSANELESIDEINLDGTADEDGGITNLAGIEYLTELTILSCSYNAGLSTLDLQENTKLKQLICSSTGITALDLSEHNALTYVDVSASTSVTNIDVSNCSALTELDAGGCTALTGLSMSLCPQITTVNIDNTNIAEFRGIGLGGQNLETLSAKYAGLDDDKAAVITTGLPSTLKHLDFEGNSITSLDVNRLTSLQSLNVSGNAGLTMLSATNCQELTELNISDCGITGIYTGYFTKLVTLEARNYQGGSLNVYGLNTLTTLDVSGSTNLTQLDVGGCASLANLEISGCTGIQNLNLTGLTSLKDLDTTTCDGLETLIVSYSGMEAMDISNPLLRTLDVTNTPMMGMSIQNCPNLTTLTLENMHSVNQINVEDVGVTEVIINNCTFVGDSNGIFIRRADNLFRFETRNSTISSILLEECTKLELLDCSGTGASNIDTWGSNAIKTYKIDGTNYTTFTLNGTAIEEFSAANCSQLTSLTLQNSSSLTTVDVSGCPVLTTLDLTGCTALTSIDVTGVNGSDSATAEITVNIAGTTLTEANFTKSANLTINLVNN